MSNYRWNRHAYLSPLVRSFLDAALRMPGDVRRTVDILDRVLPDVRGLLADALERGMGIGGYDRDVADAVSQALASIVDARCRGATAEDEVYRRVLAGAVIGVGIGAGGMQAHGRYLRRFGAISRFVEMGLHGVAFDVRRQRESLTASLAETDLEGAAPQRLLPSSAVGNRGEAVVVAQQSSPPRAVLPLADLVTGGFVIRRVGYRGCVVLHGRDLFTAFGFRDPSVSLSQSVLKAANADDFVVFPFVDSRGVEQQTTFVTLAGLLNIVLSMSLRMRGRPLAHQILRGVFARLVSVGPPDVDVVAGAVLTEATAALATYRRRAAVLESQVDRQAELARSAVIEAGVLREQLEEAGADTVFLKDLEQVRAENEGLVSRIAALTAQNARLREDNGGLRRDFERLTRWRADVAGMVDRDPESSGSGGPGDDDKIH